MSLLSLVQHADAFFEDSACTFKLPNCKKIQANLRSAWIGILLDNHSMFLQLDFLWNHWSYEVSPCQRFCQKPVFIGSLFQVPPFALNFQAAPFTLKVVYLNLFDMGLQDSFSCDLQVSTPRNLLSRLLLQGYNSSQFDRWQPRSWTPLENIRMVYWAISCILCHQDILFYLWTALRGNYFKHDLLGY